MPVLPSDHQPSANVRPLRHTETCMCVCVSQHPRNYVYQSTYAYPYDPGSSRITPTAIYSCIHYAPVKRHRVLYTEVVNVSSAPSPNTITTIINISSSTGFNNKQGQTIRRTVTIHRKHAKPEQAQQQRHALVQAAPPAQHHVFVIIAVIIVCCRSTVA